MAGLFREEKLGEEAQPSAWAGECVGSGGVYYQDVSLTGTGNAEKGWWTVSALIC